MDTSTAIARWIAPLLTRYDAFGSRRTGTPGDIACAHWLAEAVQSAGVAAQAMQVPLDVRAALDAYVAIDGRRIDGLPLFDAPDAPHEGIAGSLTLGGYAGGIGVLDLEPGAASIKGQDFEALRRGSRCSALVVATRVAGGSLAPINAQYFNAPFGPPVLQVAGGEHDRLAKLAAANVNARVVVRSARTPGHSLNLAAHIPLDTTGAPLVLLTPRTSWYESTAERAGGIVAWLEGLRHAAMLARERLLGRPVFAFSTCGHELGHLGLERILAAHGELVAGAHRWLHLGANLGCATDGRLMLRATDPAEGDALKTALVRYGYEAALIETSPIATALGEARDLADHGARVVSLIGKNAHFHAPSDRYPGNVDVFRLAAVVAAVQEWITHA